MGRSIIGAALQVFACFVLAMYPTKVLLGKAMLYVRAYADAQVQFVIDMKLHKACEASQQVASAVPAQCLRATQDINRWPFVRAFERVLDSLHSCGDFTCSDLFLYVMNSWGVMLVVLAALAIVLWNGSKRTEHAYNAVYEAMRPAPYPLPSPDVVSDQKWNNSNRVTDVTNDAIDDGAAATTMRWGKKSSSGNQFLFKRRVEASSN